MDGRSLETVNMYLASWEHQALDWISSISGSEIDLATAVFLLEGLFEISALIKYGDGLLTQSDAADAK